MPEDHPRGCGDMAPVRKNPRKSHGSPPRVRGHALSIGQGSRCNRITPAGAGTCYPGGTCPAAPWDHPRGCGDMRSLSGTAGADWGSPPRVRGHVCILPVGPGIAGITPAGAGTCLPGYRHMGTAQDHPRGCGDMELALTAVSLFEGSPPRVRGHVFEKATFGRDSGITPAGAGT